MSDFYAQLAAELRSMADAVEPLSGRGLPELVVSVDVQTRARTDADRVRTVDAVATALLGTPGHMERMPSGSFHHTVSGRRGDVRVSVFDGVSDPAARERDDELARLRAELAALRTGAGVA
jgi:isopentenyl diphosphate isomerase/L-lactate dehydrogenase-like FMN-dependent dehydrogenase